MYVTHVVRSKVIQCPGNLNLFRGVEKRIGELLAFSQCAFYDLESRYIAQEVADRLVWISGVGMWVLSCLDAGVTFVGCKEESGGNQLIP